MRSPLSNLRVACCTLAARSAPSIIFIEFGTILAPFLMDFGMMLFINLQVTEATCHETQCQESAKKTAQIRQELPRTAKIFVKSNCKQTLASKLRSTICRSQNDVNRHKRQATKWGGGGARAARRIRIRRPLLAERGSEACRMSTPRSVGLQSLPQPPPYPPTPPQSCPDFRHWLPTAAILQIFGRLFADKKFIKNQTPPKASQNLKHPPHERQNLDLGTICGAILASIFIKCSIFFEKGEKRRRLCTFPTNFNENPWFGTPKTSHFSLTVR